MWWQYHVDGWLDLIRLVPARAKREVRVGPGTYVWLSGRVWALGSLLLWLEHQFYLTDQLLAPVSGARNHIYQRTEALLSKIAASRLPKAQRRIVACTDYRSLDPIRYHIFERGSLPAWVRSEWRCRFNRFLCQIKYPPFSRRLRTCQSTIVVAGGTGFNDQVFRAADLHFPRESPRPRNHSTDLAARASGCKKIKEQVGKKNDVVSWVEARIQLLL